MTRAQQRQVGQLSMPASVHPDHPDYDRERYDVYQAAAYLMRSHDTIRRAIHAKQIGYRRDGGQRYAFSQRHLDAWRMAGRVEPMTHPVRRRAAAVPAEQSLTPIHPPAVRRFRPGA